MLWRTRKPPAAQHYQLAASCSQSFIELSTVTVLAGQNQMFAVCHVRFLIQPTCVLWAYLRHSLCCRSWSAAAPAAAWCQAPAAASAHRTAGAVRRHPMLHSTAGGLSTGVLTSPTSAETCLQDNTHAKHIVGHVTWLGLLSTRRSHTPCAATACQRLLFCCCEYKPTSFRCASEQLTCQPVQCNTHPEVCLAMTSTEWTGPQRTRHAQNLPAGHTHVQVEYTCA